MNGLKTARTCFMLCSLAVVLGTPQAFAQQNSAASTTAVQNTDRDGQHDFDPLIGSWKFHVKRLMHPLTGSTTWVEFDGTGVCYKLWDGRSQLDTIELDSPDAGHLEGLTLRLYNPQSHQWRLYWANSKISVLDPPQIGEFKNGRGDFYDQETIDGKTILVRFSIWGITANTAQSEQAFSDDGGKTWETNWVNRYTRQ